MASKTPKLDCGHETEEGEEETERGNWGGLPPELLIMIFNHLLVADLLSCSVVSKTWKKASRDVLKRSRECCAYINYFPQDVYDLINKSASTDLMQMVNGLHIRMRPNGENQNPVPSSSSFCRQDVGCSSINSLMPKESRRKLMNVALSSQVRYLNLDMKDKWERVLPLEDVALLRELISGTSESLHKLVIWQDECCRFMSSCGREFSNLKVVQVRYFRKDLEESLLKKFLTEFAPNLEEIRGEMLVVGIHNQENQFMLKRSKSLFIFYYNDMIPKLFIEDYRCISGLRRLDLRVCHVNSLDEDNILFSMVLKSLSTLEELCMYTPEFYKLFRTSDQLKFPNLRRLSLGTDPNISMGNEIAVLKQLNLPKLCPNVERFELCLDQGDHDDEPYIEEDCSPAALPDGTDQSHVPMQIEFEYREDHYSHEYFEFLIKIYPKIKKVFMLSWQLEHNIYEISRIFSDVRSLEYLGIIAFHCRPRTLDFQMDALLCGIGIEEVEFLFNSSPRTIAELKPCIVPTRPTLFNAKNLKELNICGQATSRGAAVCRSWVIQVTENLPTRHVRSLKVTFGGTDELYNRINRLRAFTTLHCAQ